MIRRVLTAYTIEWIKCTRQPFTFIGPVLVVVLVLLAPLSYPLNRDGASDYAFIAYAAPMALNPFGFPILPVFRPAPVPPDPAKRGPSRSSTWAARPTRKGKIWH